MRYCRGTEGWADRHRLVFDDAPVKLLKLHGSVDEQFLLGGLNKLTASGPFLELLAEFRRDLSMANRVTCIGYSFRDPHINASIAAALDLAEQQDRPMKLVVVDLAPPTEWPNGLGKRSRGDGRVYLPVHDSAGEALKKGVLAL